jgi:site-specific recombinase
MLESKYQRVGALAGFLMFLGAWLSGYYHGWLIPTVAVVAVLAAIWFALEQDSEEQLSTRVMRGFSIGILAGLVSRILGMLTMAWAFDSWTNSAKSSYTSISDAFRIMLNGKFWTSVLFILAFGIVGAFIAYSIPYFSADREEE